MKDQKGYFIYRNQKWTHFHCLSGLTFFQAEKMMEKMISKSRIYADREIVQVPMKDGAIWFMYTDGYTDYSNHSTTDNVHLWPPGAWIPYSTYKVTPKWFTLVQIDSDGGRSVGSFTTQITASEEAGIDFANREYRKRFRLSHKRKWCGLKGPETLNRFKIEAGGSELGKDGLPCYAFTFPVIYNQ